MNFYRNFFFIVLFFIFHFSTSFYIEDSLIEESLIDDSEISVPLWCGRPYNKTKEDNPSIVILPGINPYTYETNEGTIILHILNEKWIREKLHFKAERTNGKVLLNTNFIASNRNSFLFDLFSLSNQPETVVICTLSKLDGTILEVANTSFWRYPSVGYEVKIDNWNNGLIVDQLPFINYGIYISYENATYSSEFISTQTMSGFNTILPYYNGIPDNDFINFLDIAHSMGYRIIFDIHGFAQEPPSKEKMFNITKTVNIIKDHPALLAWYIADEPDGPGNGMDPSILEEVYLLIKEIDPYHPILLVLNCLNSAPRYIGTTDIIMSDPYPIALVDAVGCDYCESNPSAISTRVKDVLYEIRANPKPYWIVLQAFGGDQHWLREPTPGEERAMAFLALVSGITGIQVFIEGYPMSQSLWAECRLTTLQIADLLPAILSKDIAPLVVSNNPSIHVSAYANANIITIIAINSENVPKQFTVTANLDYTGKAQVMFEQGRNVSVTQGSITDIIDCFGMRTYRFDIDYQRKQKIYDDNNYVINPSFEEQTNVGIPDGYRLYVNGLGASCISDSRIFHEGNHSLRMTATEEGKDITVYSFGVSLNKNLTYEISLWAKAEYDQTIFSFQQMNNWNFVRSASTEWTKYSVLWKPTTPNSENGRFRVIITLESVGKLWIDTLQLKVAS